MSKIWIPGSQKFITSRQLPFQLPCKFGLWYQSVTTWFCRGSKVNHCCARVHNLLLYINWAFAADCHTRPEGKNNRFQQHFFCHSTKMGIQKSFLQHIAIAFLAANIIAQVHCLPKGRGDELRRQEMERIRANILTRLGLTEPLDSGEPLTVDEEAVVAAFREYQMGKEGRRVHTKDNSGELIFVGQLQGIYM